MQHFNFVMKENVLILLCLCVHFVFLFSIFDIYFKSPIIKGIQPYQPDHDAVADRLVLFVTDGLRAESFVNHTTMPYLRSLAKTHGLWGISNTRVPTESRPGHVAIIAGFYEDPSAVMKGWKENPVDFDSVFNQTVFTWCWGTYDIVEIFTRGSENSKIFVNKFDPYDQSFSTEKNTTLLDTWVFDKVKHFFEDAKYNRILNEKLHQKRIIFFLHLLGTDTAGHTHKPNTPNYLINLKHADNGVKEIVKLFEDFYGSDNKTTFLMTSDHGMTDWGSHGTGDDHETQTPYVLWGAGIKTKLDQPTRFNDIVLDLPNDRRHDINQADLAPLMSTILSIPVPVNSVGIVPISLLNMTLANKAKAVYSNSRQLASQYNKKRLEIETTALPVLYKSFEPFDKTKYNELIEHTEKMLSKNKFEKLILLSEEIMHLSLTGLAYYHNYYQRILLVSITLSFVGWIVYLLTTILKQNLNTQVQYHKRKIDTKLKGLNRNFFKIVSLLIFLTSSVLIYVQKLPIQYHIYCTLPLFLWYNVGLSSFVWVRAFSETKRQRKIVTVAAGVFCYIIGSIALALSFTYRWMLSIPLFGMALWPFHGDTSFSQKTLVVWSCTCILLSCFSFMPVIGKHVHIELVVAAGLIWCAIYFLYGKQILLPLYWTGEESKKEVVLAIMQAVLLLMALHNVYVQSKRFENGTSVVFAYQILAWCIAFLSILLPLLSTQRLVSRMLIINTSMLTFYLLLSVAHEGLFFITLAINVMCWIFIEHSILYSVNNKITKFTFASENVDLPEYRREQILNTERGLIQHDFRRAFFFLIYIILAFFGTGNIASLNSFEVRWVTCFITSFQPFIITTLILFKTLAPIISVACSFRAIQLITKAPTGYLNIIVLIFTNIMGLQLLYHVKNTGSWLEIGTSISQYVIVQVITLFIVLIHNFAKFMTQQNFSKLVHIFELKKKHV